MTAVVAIDLDLTLTNFLETFVEWYNNTKETTKITLQDLTSSKMVYGEKEDEDIQAFYDSKEFQTLLKGREEEVKETLKSMRQYFSLLVVTDRPRRMEKDTREWIDLVYPGFFDKLVFLDQEKREEVNNRKKKIYEDFKVKVAIGTDLSGLVEEKEIPKIIQIGPLLPWDSTSSRQATYTVEDWSHVTNVLKKIIQELDLAPVEKVFPGRKLSKYMDDLVTISSRKSAAFYANVIVSKFLVQKQENIRIQAIEDAIPIAIQTVELLKSKHQAIVKKISTRYRLKRGSCGAPSFRVPKMEVIVAYSTDEVPLEDSS